MTRIYTSATINRPIETIFDYVTTPGHWPEWHPSSLGVTGATDHSLEPGEQVEEAFSVAGRQGRVLWTVKERSAPNRWVIEGKILTGPGGGVITYALTSPAGGDTGSETGVAGVFFEREFVYPAPNPLYALLDWLILRRRIQAESVEAMRRLKAKLEQA